MIAYLDASVVLRLILGEPNKLAEWRRVQTAVASALTEVECLRTLDRLGRQGTLADKDVASRREEVYRLLEGVEVVDVARQILRRASEPFPAPIGTLDAIHLATAIAWRDSTETTLVMATHDKALAVAARSVGLQVIGEGNAVPTSLGAGKSGRAHVASESEKHLGARSRRRRDM